MIKIKINNKDLKKELANASKKFIDSSDFEFPCSHCTHTLKEKIGRLKNNPNITCPSCKRMITLNANKLRDAINSIGK